MASPVSLQKVERSDPLKLPPSQRIPLFILLPRGKKASKLSEEINFPLSSRAGEKEARGRLAPKNIRERERERESTRKV